MKAVFPILIDDEFVVKIPTLDIMTEGKNIENAIEMAREAIGLWGITKEDMGYNIPLPKNFNIPHNQNEILTLVDVNFDYYRKMEDMRTVRKNVTIPNYVNTAAERENINFSQFLTTHLIEELGLKAE